MRKPKPKRRRTDKDPQITGLVLTRRPGEVTKIETADGQVVLVQVLEVHTNHISLIFSASKDIKILRSELNVCSEEN